MTLGRETTPSHHALLINIDHCHVVSGISKPTCYYRATKHEDGYLDKQSEHGIDSRPAYDTLLLA